MAANGIVESVTGDDLPDQDVLVAELVDAYEAACGDAIEARASQVVVTKGLARAIHRLIRSGEREAPAEGPVG